MSLCSYLIVRVTISIDGFIEVLEGQESINESVVSLKKRANPA